MNREQLRFLASGILFGFLVGYVIAYAVHEPRVKHAAAPVPAAGNLGMEAAAGGGGSPAGGAGAAQDAAQQGGPVMDRLFKEIAALKDALEKDPNDVTALVRLANLNHDAGKYPQAIDLYARALKITPDDVNVRTDMGICLRQVGKVDEAISEFRTSLEHDPGHWQTWLNLGIVSLFDKKDVATASEAFAQVEKLNPGYKDLARLKEALRQVGQGAAGPDS